MLNDDHRSARRADGQGFGQAVGAYPRRGRARRTPTRSLAVAAHRLGIPLTVHVALGTDIIHMHPHASGAAIGDASLRDFRYFTSSVARLERGVYLNCGSAVVLPGGVPQGRRAGAQPRRRARRPDDGQHRFQRMYRPQTNVVTRPVAGTSGVGISLVGHHEILIPLIAAAVLEREQLQG